MPEYVVFTDKSIYCPGRMKIHTCKNERAQKYLSGVSSAPPLAFLQLAAEFDMYQLVLAGLLLCSERPNEPPLCTVSELKHCINDLRGFRGWAKANRAVKYIADGCRSMMEAKLFMVLSLPVSLGGCGLSGIVLNKKVFCPRHNACFTADLYFPIQKLIIEYDSFQYHNNSVSFSKDAERAAILEAEGYTVLSVKPRQLLRLESYTTLIQNIHKRLGKRQRLQSPKYCDRFHELWKIIQNHNPFDLPYSDPSCHRMVELTEVPDFPGVKRMYEEYVKYWEKLQKYPEIPLSGRGEP